ncbi:MAG: YjhX family toxin [Pseudomonadota bacterium]
MNISKTDQRVLHVLAQGGAIQVERSPGGKVTSCLCVSREGHVLSDCTLSVFLRLRRRRLVHSAGGAPYRISPLGRRHVRGQTDNR